MTKNTKAVPKSHKMCGAGKRGAITIEASISFSIFAMVIVTILFIMRIVYAYALVQHAINQTAKELSTYSYVYRVVGAEDIRQDFAAIEDIYKTFSSGSGSGIGEWFSSEAAHAVGGSGIAVNNAMFRAGTKALFKTYVGVDQNGAGADERLKSLRVVGGVDGVDFTASHFMEDGKTIDIVACYTIEPIFPINIMPKINLMNRACVQVMNGKNAFVKE